MSRNRTWLIAALLAGSGFCALVYQVAWFREFRLIFGASTAASAAVIAIFIGGLGVGGFLFGPRADTQDRPLRFYATLEGIVAISAGATPLLFFIVRALYLLSGGSHSLGGLLATAARLILSALVLAVPTIAMGGTLPAAARAATRDTDTRRRDVAALYALNTLGAVAGCLLATFWMLETFGTHATIWIAAVANLLIAAAAWFVAAPGAAPGTAPGTAPATKALSTKAPQHPSTSAPGPAWFLLFASGAVGFAFFLMELVWYRMLSPLLGGSVFTFGLVLAIALVGVGLGGLLYALVSGDKPASMSGFATTCTLEGAVLAATFALGDRLAVLAMALQPLQVAGFSAHVAGWMIVTAIAVLPPALVAGYQFPQLIALFGQGRDRVGEQVGFAYAANTVGAIAGSLAGGFGLLPWLSATGAWQLAAVILLVLGAAAAVKGDGGNRPRSLLPIVLQLALVVLAIVFVRATGPTAAWRQSGIGAGRTPRDVFASSNQLRGWANIERRGVIWAADGVESSIALTLDPTGYAFMVNGKADGSARADAGTQVMSGLLATLANPAATRAFVIGLGTGSTAGWLGAVPSMSRVDVVEMEPRVLDVARACTPVNRDVLNNPKVRVIIGDAREVLLTTRDRYDIIASEPSNPYRAGVASLFTLEYYQAAADRLNDDGVFAQWVQGYEIDGQTFSTIYATLARVFPQIEAWHTSRDNDLVLIASKRRHTYNARAMNGQLAQEPFRTALASVWRATDIHGLLSHFIANDSLARSIAGSIATLNTDDRNIVEFGLARSVGRPVFLAADLRNASRKAGASRPPFDSDGDVNWPQVDTASVSYNAGEGSFGDLRYQGPPNEQARQAALVQYYQNNDLNAAWGFWRRQPEPPRDPNELAMLADIAANQATDDALPFIERLRTYQPAEADTLLATLRLRQLKLADAAAAVESALTRLRTDPWPPVRSTQRALQVAEILASRDKSLARRMFDAMGQPFAVRGLEDVRIITRAGLSRQVDFSGLCAGVVSALEPDVPWNEGFLQLRRDCYQASGNSHLPDANRDLAEFLAAQSSGF